MCNIIFFRYMFFICLLYTNLSYTSTSNSSINKTNKIQNNSSFISSLLCIQYPLQIKNAPMLKGYYKGNRLTFYKDFCTIIEQSVLTYFTLVITQEVKHVAGGNNVKWLERIPNMSAKVYYISYTGNPKKAWDIEPEEDLKKISCRIPNNALVLLIPAELIEALKTVPQHNENQEDPRVIYLPKIVIKPNATQSELDNAHVISSLAALDLDTIHENNKSIVKQVGNTVMSFNSIN